jgi:hypothetical protein
MNSRLWAVLVGIFLVIGAMVLPQMARAQSQWPKLRVVYTARNLTAGTDWSTDLQADAGDILQLRAVLSDTVQDSIIKNVNIIVPLISYEGKVQHPRFSLGAMNSGILDTDVAIDVGDKYLQMKYLPGFAKVTVGGNTTAISPDTETANLTTQEIRINDIPYGDGNAVTVTYEVQMVGVGNSNSSGSNSGGIGGGEVAGTASAVASTNPKTGIGDSLWLSTGGWLALGVGGIGLKKLAMKIWERTLV